MLQQPGFPTAGGRRLSWVSGTALEKLASFSLCCHTLRIQSPGPHLKNEESSFAAPEPNWPNCLLRTVRLFTHVFVCRLLELFKIIVPSIHWFLPVVFFCLNPGARRLIVNNMTGRACAGNAARVWWRDDACSVPAPGGSQSLTLLSYPGTACRRSASQGLGRLANDYLDYICFNSRLFGDLPLKSWMYRILSVGIYLVKLGCHLRFFPV